MTRRSLTGNDIKRARLRYGMTQREFADFLNVSKKTIERWEMSSSEVTGPAAVLIELMGVIPDLTEKIKVPPREMPLRLWYMEGDDVCAVIDVDEAKRLVNVYNYDYDYIRLPFGRNREPSFEDYEAFLESRCFPRTRDKIKLELDKIGIPFYDPMLIISRTEGRMAGDDFRVLIER